MYKEQKVAVPFRSKVTRCGLETKIRHTGLQLKKMDIRVMTKYNTRANIVETVQERYILKKWNKKF